MKLAEGEKHDFFVERIVNMGDNSYYLLKGTEGVKYLLKKDLYENYNINTGDIINCRVDKINCRGEVFLEPENPYYKDGQEYEFDLISVSDKPDGPGKLLLVGDKYGLKHKVSVPEDFNTGKKLILRVEKIRKGWPLLIPV
ncbi:MAG TPA: hypothetical protein DEQ09_11770 [Bacteroidales bacterium]|nr:hypothetical protein [Bacteroidales bacterium]